MDRWQGKVAIVTGASSGIGAAIAKDLVECGMKVVGIARRLEKMEKNGNRMNSYKGGIFYPVECDVVEEDQIIETFEWVKKKLGGIDVLVNSAGIFRQTMLSDPDNSEILRNILDVNVLGLSFCIREALKSLKERKVAGHIININSISGHYIPWMHGLKPEISMNGGSKHCVTALTDSLRQELIYLGNKTKVTSISPGVVLTEMISLNFEKEQLKEFIKYNPYLEPEDVSQAVVYCLSTPERVQVHELTIRPVGEKF